MLTRPYVFRPGSFSRRLSVLPPYCEWFAEPTRFDAAVYDLKAVNLRAVADGDQRRFGEIIDSMEAHGRTINDALARLRDLVAVKQ